MSSYSQLPRTPRLQSIPLPPVAEDYFDQELLKHALQNHSSSPSSDSLVLSPYTPPKPSPVALDHFYGQFQSMSINSQSNRHGQHGYSNSRGADGSFARPPNVGRRLG